MPELKQPFGLKRIFGVFGLTGRPSASGADRFLRVNSNDQLQVEVVGGTTKVLGQSAPTASTETSVYAVPSGKTAKVHALWIANRSASVAMSVDLGIKVGGGSLGNPSYLMKGLSVNATEFLVIDGNPLLTMGALDDLRVNISTANGTVSAFGFES